MNLTFLNTLGNLEWFVWPLLGAIAALGLLAFMSPARFAVIAYGGGTWIDTDKIRQILDQRVDIDRYVVRYGRFFGLLVIGAALLIGYMYYTRVLGNPPLF